MMTNTKYHRVSPVEFVEVIALVPAMLKPFLTIYSAQEYKASKSACYLSEDKQSGYAITGENDLISVFSLPGAKQGQDAVKSAIENGAVTLDCMDGYLPRFYATFGFVEYSRAAWDEQYAPGDWDYERFGRPDIVFMRLAE